MTCLKAPGSDGFYALFFQTQWDLVGGVVYDLVQKVFTGHTVDPEFNNLLIVLKPKFANLESFVQFRSISLCSILYKLVMKVIANRFKVVFYKIITPEQTGFIVGRNITNNIIVTQEVIHLVRRKQKNKKWITIKMDLEKAYDRARSDFIEASLYTATIPVFLINVIMSIITSSSL
ncbi:hypothetical protein PVK06_009580 [Gossypium arboreum]|uniref:Reverse transcriptase domain-containing protein n=1 Tax=Gossypium arboreum TaxID=29729 RepID=A0ABR0QP38_GOSAR|nr:hypothetical protein PVK06_009580 [Gossypium arboreum]